MRIEKYVEFAQEVEINLSTEDIYLILENGDDDTVCKVLCDISNLAQYLKAVPEKIIKQMSSEQKTLINKFLVETAEKFKPNALND